MASIMTLDSQPYIAVAILQTFLYALYLVSFVHALRWLLYEEEGWKLKSRDTVNRLFLTIAILVFAFSTVDLVFEVMLQLTSSGGFDSQVNHLFAITSIVMESITALITGAALINRCWLVYRSLRIICFPLGLWLANVILFIICITISVCEKGIMNSPVSLLALRLFYCCNCAMNLYATGAIVYREGRANSSKSSILYCICHTVAATGSLYALTSLPLVVIAFFVPIKMSAYLICDTVNSSMAGITFNLLLIRVGQLHPEVEMDDNGSGHDVSASILPTELFRVSTLSLYDEYEEYD